MRQIFAFKSHYQKVKEFYKRFERWLMPLTLTIGFIADYVTFVSIQVNTAIIILFIYWIVAALCITFVHLYDAGKISQKYNYIRLFIPLLIQFTFGGLLSNSFIFYWFSGSVYTSWPFILAFVFLMVSNDALRHYYERPVVQLSVYFFGTLSIFSVSLPFIFNSLDPKLFVFASAISLISVGLFVFLLSSIREYVKLRRTATLISFVVIIAIMNAFYFFNIIPPVPLALRETGVYHSVRHLGSKYILKGEQQAFWQKLLPGQTIHLKNGERAYVYSAIFAPDNLNTTIIHEWQYFDEQKGQWVVKDKLSFKITGGRTLGFRGYSYKTTWAEGTWRVYVKTQRGQTLGRLKFKIEKTETSAQLIEAVR